MNPKDIIRAWKDEDFRASLADAPANPAGLVAVDDADLKNVAGGTVTTRCTQWSNKPARICCC